MRLEIVDAMIGYPNYAGYIMGFCSGKVLGIDIREDVIFQFGRVHNTHAFSHSEFMVKIHVGDRAKNPDAKCYVTVTHILSGMRVHYGEYESGLARHIAFRLLVSRLMTEPQIKLPSESPLVPVEKMFKKERILPKTVPNKIKPKPRPQI